MFIENNKKKCILKIEFINTNSDNGGDWRQCKNWIDYLTNILYSLKLLELFDAISERIIKQMKQNHIFINVIKIKFY